MIRTVTLGAGFDEVFRVESRGGSATGVVLHHVSRASGKGVNAARTLHHLGIPVRAYVLAGSSDAPGFASSLAQEGIECRITEVPGSIRRNLTVLHEDSGGPSAHFRAPIAGLVGVEALNALTQSLESEIEPGDVVSLHGGTPLGVPTEGWLRIAQTSRERGAMIAADVYGPALPTLLEGIHVGTCKINAEEAETLVAGLTQSQDESAARALKHMVGCGVERPIVTLGAGGARCVVNGRVWALSLPAKPARMTVGAGDAFAAGVLASVGAGDSASLAAVCNGIAAAVAHVMDIPVERFSSEVEELRRATVLEERGALG